jgi:hypothetical protein
MAKAKALLVLKLEAYEASALLSFLERHAEEFADPDLAGAEDLEAIADTLRETIPQMSFVPSLEDDGGDDAGTPVS